MEVHVIVNEVGAMVEFDLLHGDRCRPYVAVMEQNNSIEVMTMKLDLALLRQKRQEHKLRLIDVAKYLDLETANAYWRIETGITNLSAVRLMRLCSLLNIEPEVLLSAK